MHLCPFAPTAQSCGRAGGLGSTAPPGANSSRLVNTGVACILNGAASLTGSLRSRVALQALVSWANEEGDGPGACPSPDSLAVEWSVPPIPWLHWPWLVAAAVHPVSLSLPDNTSREPKQLIRRHAARERRSGSDPRLHGSGGRALTPTTSHCCLPVSSRSRAREPAGKATKLPTRPPSTAK